MQNLNKEEMLIGFIFGVCFWPVLGWGCLGVAIPSAFLWAESGAGGSKLYRRLGCPLVAALQVFYVTHRFQVFVAVPLAFIILSIGYGIPSTQPPDEGSALGRFWYRISPEHAIDLTRSTIYLALYAAFAFAVNA